MGIIQKLIEKHQEKLRITNEECDKLLDQLSIATTGTTQMFEDKEHFIDPKEVEVWHSRHAALLQTTNLYNIKKLRKAKQYGTLCISASRFFNLGQVLKSRISAHNDVVATNKINAAYELIGDIEGHALDRQQMLCIVKEAPNHLVIAGAGTGKTTTVIGKIKYLLMSGKYAPEDILVLSFTNASATEMCERIHKETGYPIEASTFHKLGLNIIKKVEGLVPKISQINLRNFVREQIGVHIKDSRYLMMLSNYLLYNRVVAKSEFDFSTKAEYDDYLSMNPPTTLKNEVVKSYGEMEIANFLAQNSIEYIYEKAYPIDTRNTEYGQYIPDFFLPEYNIYIEYFGINRSGEVPAYFSASHGMSATAAYQASMKWKRKTHEEYGTTMVECYAYEKFDGTLLDNLKHHLENQGVALRPKSSEELWEEISKEDHSILDGIIELFETVINLMKSNEFTIDNVRQLNKNNSNVQGNNTLLSLIEPIYVAYNTQLSQNHEIDFNDMINVARRYVQKGKYVNPYKFVIVDEYQDISKARFNLLHQMRQSSYYDLFCVGDDWQSIYRFAGSDIGFILNFEKYWGKTEISKIETTYRFTRQLIEISGTFIMQNPAQIKKSIKGNSDSVGFALGEISGYTDQFSIEFMAKKLDDLPNNSSVYLIGRYSFDGNLLQENPAFTCQYDKATGTVAVRYNRRPDLTMHFLTAHKSKGLQADYVFILNNKNSRMGFPSKIQDSPILDLLLEKCDQFPHSEERRLFYVALTRAKKKAFILTVKDQESVFAQELKKRYEDGLKREHYECPLCGGTLVHKKGPYGDFMGCSNYKTTGCRYKRSLGNK